MILRDGGREGREGGREGREKEMYDNKEYWCRTMNTDVHVTEQVIKIVNLIY